MTFNGDKKYPKVVFQDHDTTQTGYNVCCRKCSKRLFVTANRSGALPVQLIERKARDAGWTINSKGATCPKHDAKKSFADAMAKVDVFEPASEPRVLENADYGAIELRALAHLQDRIKVVTGKNALNTGLSVESKQETPAMTDPADRQPTRDQKRAIVRMIDDNWDESARHYNADMTDQKIADTLNVPRKWVSDCRVELFGDSGRNLDYHQLITQAKSCVADAKAAEDRVMGEIGKLEAPRVRMETLISKMEKML